MVRLYNDIFDRFNFVTIFFTIIVEIVVVLVSNSKNHLKQLHMKFSREHLDIAFNIWYKITLFTSQVLVTYWLFCLKVFTTTVTFNPWISSLLVDLSANLQASLLFSFLASWWTTYFQSEIYISSFTMKWTASGVAYKLHTKSLGIKISPWGSSTSWFSMMGVGVKADTKSCGVRQAIQIQY